MEKKFSRIFGSFIAISLSLSIPVFATTADSAQNINTEKKQFVHQLATQQKFNEKKLTALLNSLHRDPVVIARITKPYEKKPWTFYQGYFVTPRRISLGVEYMQKHHRELVEMQKRYGIPPSMITAIIGIETEYGNILGKFHVLNTLYTLGFYYPPRAPFFRKELGEYLILAHKNHLPPKQMMGSYAGAFGIPQFMPSSYRHYAVSAHQKNTVNLYQHDDAIASVANYFHKMGWQANQPVAKLLSWKYAAHPSSTKRLMLPTAQGKEYWATYPNFKVIMRYNTNTVYAMAVYQLSQAIEKKFNQTASRSATQARRA